MSSQGLWPLIKLHRIDLAILEIRKRAAALDPGKQLMASIAQVEAEFGQRDEESKALAGELLDLELKQKSIEEKIKKFDKQLYGGSVINPREVANIEKEIQMLKSQSSDNDGRILELWELSPPAKARAEEAKARLENLKQQLVVHQREVLRQKAELEAEFKVKTAERPSAAKEVPPGLLTQYEAIKTRAGGIGLSSVDKHGNCSECGVSVPTKTLESVKAGEIVACGACHRILFREESLA